MKKIILFILCFPSLLLGAFWNWEYISSEHFQGYYQKPNKRQAIKGLYFLEKYKSKVDSLTGFSGTGAFNLGYHFLGIPKLFTNQQITQKIPIVFQDVGQANGYANPLKPKISLFANKLRSDQFVWGQSWYRVVGVHEYTHIAQMSARQGNILAAILGNWVSPNIYQPLWLLEGYTVHSESQIATNEGRLSNGIYSAVAGSQKFFGTTPSLTQLTFYDSNNFPASASYLYGGLLVDYLAKTYGRQRLAEYARRVDDQGLLGLFNIILPSFFMDAVAQNVFGANFATLYQRAIDQLPALCTDPSKELPAIPEGNVLEYLAQDGICYYTLEEHTTSGVPIAGLYRWAEGNSERLRSMLCTGDYSFQLQGNQLYYRKPVLRTGFANIDQMGSGVRRELYALDLQTGKQTRLVKNSVQSFFVDSLQCIYYTVDKADSYGSELYQKQAGDEPKLLLTSHKYISQTIRDGQSFVFTAKAELGSIGLYSWELGQSELTPLLNSPWTEADALLDGHHLLYTANYGGRLAGYRYTRNDKSSTGIVQRVTSAEFAHSVSIDRDLVYYLGLGKDGYRLCRDTIASESYTPPADEPEQEFSCQELHYTQHGNAALRNLASIIVPDARISPVFQYGTDILGTTQYMFSVADGWSLNAITTIFDPLIFNIFCQNSDNFLLQAYLPVYSSLAFGLKNIYLLGGYEYDESLQSEEEWFAGLNLVFNFPRDYLSLTAKYDNQEQVDGELDYAHYFSLAQIVLKAQACKLGDDNLAWSEKEKLAYLYYLHRFWRIDKGFRTPSIFIRDLAIKFFGEYDRAELAQHTHEQDTKFGVGLVPRVLSLQGNLLGELEMGARWQKEDEHSDYQPEFYTKLVFSY